MLFSFGITQDKYGSVCLSHYTLVVYIEEYPFSMFICFGFENVATCFLNFSRFLCFFALFALFTLVETDSDLRFWRNPTCPFVVLRFLRILAYFSVSCYLYK
ncbi:hypothetical protein C8J56DRAFT_932085 [Mycena floridula]|nr:hypothetical protein C8J56DRAFT_932085 [Mycena floridula]